MSSSPCVRIWTLQERLDVLEVGVVGAVERLQTLLRKGDLLHVADLAGEAP